MLENHGQPTLHEWNPNLTNRKITALIRATRVVGQFDGIKDSTTIGWPWLANDICDVRHHGGNVYWPPAWNCQNAKGCIVLWIKRQDARSGIVCVARNDSGNDENIKLTPFVVEERSLEHWSSNENFIRCILITHGCG